MCIDRTLIPFLDVDGAGEGGGAARVGRVGGQDGFSVRTDHREGERAAGACIRAPYQLVQVTGQDPAAFGDRVKLAMTTVDGQRGRAGGSIVLLVDVGDLDGGGLPRGIGTSQQGPVQCQGTVVGGEGTGHVRGVDRGRRRFDDGHRLFGGTGNLDAVLVQGHEPECAALVVGRVPADIAIAAEFHFTAHGKRGAVGSIPAVEWRVFGPGRILFVDMGDADGRRALIRWRVVAVVGYAAVEGARSVMGCVGRLLLQADGVPDRRQRRFMHGDGTRCATLNRILFGVVRREGEAAPIVGAGIPVHLAKILGTDGAACLHGFLDPAFALDVERGGVRAFFWRDLVDGDECRLAGRIIALEDAGINLAHLIMCHHLQGLAGIVRSLR